MKEQVKRIEVDGEEVFIQKDFLGWHFVHPTKNTDGTINWKNLIAGGSWIRLLAIGGFVFLVLMATREYSSLAVSLNECLNKTLPIIIP